jgi:hypothetical protein
MLMPYGDLLRRQVAEANIYVCEGDESGGRPSLSEVAFP